MSNNLPPVALIEPEQLASQLQDENLLILDVCNPATYQQAHIPGAVHIAPKELTCNEPPATGMLPSLEHLNAVLSRVGYQQDKHIVVYDDEGGGWAGRLIWTLDLLGHQKISYLNGGLHAWLAAKLPLQKEPVTPDSTSVEATIVNHSVRAKAEDIMAELAAGEASDMVVWDARSPEEHAGIKQFATRAGHIPGAINYEWTRGMDAANQYRLHPNLQAQLNSLGLSADKNIVTHCQTHHRSGFTYMAGRILGYQKIRAYDGSWSEWGNRADTPITTAD
ncbi:sulfurtransferase [Sansalvadorimonas verongulae]|uniref:sulfurtransferase n=1 Tax=Sansalvadorimonas verongulae TaxID=2172824 RepID=UPI0012BB597A|nr:rhodanese-like domain-containing protein [Sansalvadorimonas verongulae]MTI13841.1 sulfurtransferase [Sansalvadorimonas verongulae]